MARKVILIAAAAVILIGGGAAALWYRGSGEAAPVYRTAPARKTSLVATISATGTLVPEDVVDVGTQVNGQIASFGNDKDGKPVDYRSAVTEGGILATIDDSIYSADVATSRAQLAQAEAQVRLSEANREQTRAKLEQASLDWARAQKLGPSAALAQADYDASKSAYEQAVAALGVSEAQIGQARASVAIANASVQRSERNLSFCTIRSPVNGVIIDKRVDIGQTVVASFNAPSLFLIAKDLSRMQVLVQVNEADIGNVRPGQPVTFTTDTYPNSTFKGEVRKIRLNATMTQNVVTYTVEIVTENPDLKLLPYLTASVRFIVDRREEVLAVPNAALRFSPRQSSATPAAAPASPSTPPQGATGTQGASAAQSKGPGEGSPRGQRGGGNGGGRAARESSTVYILEDGKLKPITVKAGLSDGTMTEVTTTELTEGMEVVIAEQVTGAPAATGATTNPFAPQMMRGGRGR